MFKLKVNNEKCTGCRACEVACSYHQGKVFNPKLASLHIRRDERVGRMSIILYGDLTQKERQKRFPCDWCVGELEPLCVKYCAPGAITLA